jgi:hypothetical protein
MSTRVAGFRRQRPVEDLGERGVQVVQSEQSAARRSRGRRVAVADPAQRPDRQERDTMAALVHRSLMVAQRAGAVTICDRIPATSSEVSWNKYSAAAAVCRRRIVFIVAPIVGVVRKEPNTLKRELQRRHAEA